MIGQIAALTRRIRVGSGGVMLPNHAPLTVAERFKVLEALFPGRIDLGLGRAPGTDPITSVALRRRQDIRDDDDFLERFQELMLLETRGFPADHPFRNVRAMPADVPLPPIYLLGSSDYSAELAAAIGAGFAFAHHFATHDAVAAMTSYRAHFKPSPALDRPARHPGGRGGRGRHRRGSGTPRLDGRPQFRAAREGRIPAAGEPGGSARLRVLADRPRAHPAEREPACSSARPQTVLARLLPLIAATRADEVMITTMIYDHAARRHSYELMAQAFGLGVTAGQTASA